MAMSERMSFLFFLLLYSTHFVEERRRLERIYPRPYLSEGLCDSLYEDRNAHRMAYTKPLEQFKPGTMIMKACRPYDRGTLCLLNNFVTLNRIEYDGEGGVMYAVVTCPQTGAHFLGPEFFRGWFSPETQADYARLQKEAQDRPFDPTYFMANGGPF